MQPLPQLHLWFLIIVAAALVVTFVVVLAVVFVVALAVIFVVALVAIFVVALAVVFMVALVIVNKYFEITKESCGACTRLYHALSWRFTTFLRLAPHFTINHKELPLEKPMPAI